VFCTASIATVPVIKLIGALDRQSAEIDVIDVP